MKKRNCKYSFIDPNDNISVFDYSPLGLLKATAVIGKGTEGDYKSNTGGFYERYAPSAWMEYDFYAFKNTGNPVWVKTTQREQHWQQDPNPHSPTIVKVEYSDGFGRLLQTRAQAEDVIFGDATFGSSGLNPVQGQTNAPAIGIERAPNSPLNVVVSGWQIYNNKGKVVEQYEPFFDKGFDYQLPGTDGVKITLYYDPLQRVVRTVNPDKSEQRVYFGKPQHLNDLSGSLPYDPTPWESFAYDANDLASITGGGNVPTTDYFTPKSTEIDALGRTIRTTEYWNNSNYSDTIVMQYRYDIRGNLLQVKDPYGRTVFEHVYDLRAPQEDENGEKQPLPPLWTKHIDSGVSVIWWDATGKVIRSEDEKGAVGLSSYGALSRPSFSWAKDNGLEDFTVRMALVYGDDTSHGPANPKTTNHWGQAYKNYDESGLDTILAYDFKGNVLSGKKQVIKDSLLIDAINAGASNNWEVAPYRVDWTATPWNEETNLLEGNYETDNVFDALNRPTETTYPADINHVRKVATTTYNRAGALQKLAYDGVDYIEHIAYDAKGGVIMTAYGNGIMTRSLYDRVTFRLKRVRTSAFTRSGWTFNDNAGVKEDKVFTYDLQGNIVSTHDKCTDCGLPSSPDDLTRNFTYDSIYRLLTATGRESNTQPSSDVWNDAAPTPSPNAQNCRTYTQTFEYDKLGNILKKIHTATGNNFTRRYNYQTGTNKLLNIDNNQSTPTVIASFSYDVKGNQTLCQSEKHYEWDYADRMRSLYNQTGTGVEPTVYAVYLYDGGGNRTKKLVRKQGGTWESVTYVGGGFEYHKKGSEEKNYTQIANVEIRTGSFTGDGSETTLYQLKDHLGSVGLRLNHSGSTIDREEYYPFGDSSLRTFTKKRYRYGGKEKDEESGLYYYGARYYMSWVGRFISVDKVMQPQQSSYCGLDNNPINKIDPTGNAAIAAERASGVQPAEPPTIYRDEETGLVIDTIDDGINQSVSVNKDQYKKAKKMAEENGLDLSKKSDAKKFNYLYSKNTLGLKYQTNKEYENMTITPVNIKLNVREMSALNVNVIIGVGYNHVAIDIPSGVGFWEGGNTFVMEGVGGSMSSSIGIEVLSMGGGTGIAKLNVNNSFVETANLAFNNGVGSSISVPAYKHTSLESKYIDYSTHSLSIGGGFYSFTKLFDFGVDKLPGMPSTAKGQLTKPISRQDSIQQALLANDPRMYYILNFNTDSIALYKNIFNIK